MIKNNDELLFLDMGTGISRFDLYEYDLADKRVNIVLSHYHLDHIIGLIYFLNICRDKDIYIWGPGKEYYGATCREILEKIISPPYFGRSIQNFSRNVTISDFRVGINNISENLCFETVLQQHSSPSFGIIVNDIFYYATDTALKDETFKRASGLQYLLHECLTLQPGIEGGKHSSLSEILKLADKYDIEHLKLIHLNPNWTSREFDTAVKMIGSRPISFAEDGDIYYW